MQQKSFFEYLGIADIERIHSQTLAWIFSKDCEAISKTSKSDLLNILFNLEGERQILNVETERNHIDILIETNQEIIIIENKIKSSQHSNQLFRYEEYCNRMFKDIKPKYFYLTLIDEDSINEKWKRISYDKIYDVLKNITLLDNNHKIILIEYLKFLKKLSEVLIDFKANTSQYDMVFLDGQRKKTEKVNFNYKNDFEKFIAKNQLETILQKSFLNSLKERITSVTSYVADTHGDGLIDFHIGSKILFKGKFYSTTIQLQRNTIKFAFSIYGDEYSSSKKEWIEEVIPIMEKLKTTNLYNYNKCNKPTSKAYVSISKKLNQNYWQLQVDELVKLLNIEIENAKVLTKLLESDLKHI